MPESWILVMYIQQCIHRLFVRWTEVTLHANFTAPAMAPLPFKCRTLHDAAQDVAVKLSSEMMGFEHFHYIVMIIWYNISINDKFEHHHYLHDRSKSYLMMIFNDILLGYDFSRNDPLHFLRKKSSPKGSCTSPGADPPVIRHMACWKPWTTYQLVGALEHCLYFPIYWLAAAMPFVIRGDWTVAFFRHLFFSFSQAAKQSN